MPGSTSRLSLPYPVPGDTVDVPRDVQALANALDPAAPGASGSLAWFAQGLASARPAPGVAGRQYFATDSNATYLDTGTAWISLGSAEVNVSDPGPSPRIGELLWVDTDEYGGLAPPSLVTSLPTGPVDGQEIYFQADPANGVVWNLRYNAASASIYKWEFLGGSSLYNYVNASESISGTTYINMPTVGPSVTVPLAGDYDITHGAQMAGPAVQGQAYLQSYAIGATAAVDADAIWKGSPAAYADSANLARTQRKTLAAGTLLQAKYRVVGGSSGTAGQRYLSALPVRIG